MNKDMSTLAESALALTAVKLLNAPKVTPAEEPDSAGLHNIMLVLGGSFWTHFDPEDPD